MKDLIKKHKGLIIRLAWALTGIVPAVLLWKVIGQVEHATAREISRLLLVAVGWSGGGLWIFLKGKLKIIAKAWISVGLMTILVWHIFDRSQAQEVVERLATISVFWMIGAFLVKGTGMGATVWRWKVLLEAQDLKVPVKHLIGTFLIGRFVGSFLPSTIGLDGYRMYDIARHSGQTARSVSVIVVEKVIGFFVLSTLVMATIPWGIRFIPATALVATAVVFLVPVTLSFVLLLNPRLIRRIFTKLLPPDTAIGAKVFKAVKAVTTYERHRRALIKAVGIGFIVHLGTIMMYFFTAHAIGVNVGIGEVMYVGPLMVFATVVPISVAGIGVRELVFSQLMGQVGHQAAAAVVFAFLGYLVGEIISLFGGLVLLARRAEYKVFISGKAMETTEEEDDLAEPEPVPITPAERPKLADYVLTGLGGGMAAGLLLGVIEAIVVVTQMQPPRDYFVLGWAAVVSGAVWAGVGATMGAAFWTIARGLRLRSAERSRRYAFIAASLFCGFGFVVTWFRLYRDLFRENVRPRDPVGMLTLVLLAVGFGGLFLLLRWALKRLTDARFGQFLLKPWGTPAAVCTAMLCLVTFGLVLGEDHAHANGTTRRAAENRPNIVLVMVDTLRADHLDLYGYDEETAPHITEFSNESVTFRNAFAQASWTRPSVATILTGRYPSSHQTTTKPDALPDEVETLAEVLRSNGYTTGGIVTNFNLAPYFNFHQGFDSYEFLEPEQLLWADDNSAKLAIYELVRRLVVRIPRPLRPEQFYQAAEVTTDQAISWLQERPEEGAPYFLFLTYMDPHDPYFRRPLDGHGIGRSFVGHPDPEMAEEILELYDGEIRYWDEHFGRLIEELRGRPDWDNTLIVVCSDHGEEFNEHGGWYHGTTLYDEQLRIPLIVRLPHSELGGTSEDRWAGLIDISPTLARLAGATVPEGMSQGVDLFTGLDGSGPSRVMYAEEDHEGNRLRSVRYGDGEVEWKFIEANANNPRHLPEQELFEMRSDPGELRNRADDDAEELTDAQSTLERAREASSQGAVSRSSLGAIDSAACEQLRALGYMDECE